MNVHYNVRDIVTHLNLLWVCKEDHISVADATPAAAPFQWKRRDAGLMDRSANGNRDTCPFLPERQHRAAAPVRHYTWPTHNRHVL